MPTETRKLVKARPKALEYLPEWAKCCKWREGFLRRLQQRMAKQNKSYSIIDTVPRSAGESYCQKCSSFEPPGIHAVLENGDYFSMELLDLDEGAYTDAH